MRENLRRPLVVSVGWNAFSCNAVPQGDHFLKMSRSNAIVDGEHLLVKTPDSGVVYPIHVGELVGRRLTRGNV